MAQLLVVDDDPVIVRLLSRYLEDCGHRVVTATDGIEAQTLVETVRFDVVIANLRMPRLDGLGLLAYARSRPQLVRVIMVSGAWTPEARQRAIALDCDRLRDKPIDLLQLVEDIDDLTP